MKVKLLDYEDLSDSRELFNAREPNFIALFIYFLLLLLISAIIWLCLGEIDIVVKATGMVRTISHVSVIRNINEGIVTQLNYKEGQWVRQGDLLYSTGNRFDEIENESLLVQKKKTLAEIGMLTRMEAGVISHKNRFQAGHAPLENEYYNRFEAFQNKYEQLKADHEQARTDWMNGKKMGADLISQNSLDQLAKDCQFAELELKKYQNETIFTIQKELQTQKDQLLQIDGRLNELAEKFSRGQVRAPISGVVQVIENFNQGDFMPAGIEVLKIVPGTKTANLKMELTIANRDIGLVKTGQRVNYRFLALPYKEYGVLAGKVRVIAGDIWAVQNSTMPYRVEGTIGKTKLFDKSEIPAEIKVGMLCDARIVVKRKKLLHIVLEKLDFR